MKLKPEKVDPQLLPGQERIAHDHLDRLVRSAHTLREYLNGRRQPRTVETMPHLLNRLATLHETLTDIIRQYAEETY